MKALPATEEATPEEVQQYLDQPAGVLKAELLSDDSCVGIDRLTGKVLVSGGGCLSSSNWTIVKTGTFDECYQYAKTL